MAKKSNANFQNNAKNKNIINDNQEIAQELNMEEVRKLANENKKRKKK